MLALLPLRPLDVSASLVTSSCSSNKTRSRSPPLAIIALLLASRSSRCVFSYWLQN